MRPKSKRDPRYVHHFIHGEYDRLFAYYQNWDESDWERKADQVDAWRTRLASRMEPDLTLHRTAPRGHFTVTVRPTSNRGGRVLKSNMHTVPVGAIVRLDAPLRHAAMRMASGRLDTVGDPRALKVVPAAIERTTPRNLMFEVRPGILRRVA